MRTKRLFVAATIIAGIVFAWFALSVPRAGVVIPEQKAEIAAFKVPSVTLRDVFKKGTRTLNGSIVVPTVCTTVSALATLDATSTPSRIILSLSIPEDTGICLQREATASFLTTLVAPADVPVEVNVNGVLATTTAL